MVHWSSRKRAPGKTAVMLHQLIAMIRTTRLLKLY
jgi:hypothetical protein